ncbi:uncharacterized protein F5147DRAFT_745702 [Suillus discolor]|uniref:Uncharacterized protein n=1 Tax=Suillus discolor TaxID=1912936 RepID=A0A9P7F7X6_9AGAM|nr:uncharacterized protein F5147DRAFT_745702 [Suillus discolor]KAG2108731.1 hypothetical protein F5147DRAFT_745702 [Suillus discolor]
MAMICALGEDYAQFTSSLILKSLDKKELKAAFLAEETQRRRRADALGVSSSDSALVSAAGAPPSSCKCGANAVCDFCEKAGHCVHKCFAMQRAREAHKTRQASNQPGKSGRRSRNANKASEASSTTSQPSPGSNASSNASSSVPASANTSSTVQNATEFAGNASLHSFDTSSPLCPLQLDADVDWNADTGATSHMTPHHHYIRNYTPKCVPIRLADSTPRIIQWPNQTLDGVA